MVIFWVFETDVLVVHKGLVCYIIRRKSFFHHLFSRSNPWENKRLPGVTGAYKGLQGLTRGYKGLQGVTRGYRRLQGVTGGDRGLQRIIQTFF